MTNPILRWTRILPRADPKHATGRPCCRSSHGVSWIQSSSRLVVYGGEHVARTPLAVQEATWACDFDSENAEEGQWRSISVDPPPLRVAHAQAVHKESSTIYVFGGRSGIQMKEEAMNDLWKLDCSGPPGSEAWSIMNPDLEHGDDLPEARSFHKMACIGDSLFVFGGCGSSGRLNDMHRFDISRQTWHNMGSSQHLRGRGGPTLLPLSSNKFLGVVAGFAGEETNDGHLFEIDSGKWAENSLSEDLKDLRSRSVCIGGSFPGAGVSVIFGGEVDPSAKGHEGAGGFENDIVLLEESTGKHLKTIPQGQVVSVPETRGWSDGAAAVGDDGGALFVFGGLSGDDAAPKRLDDLWKLQVSKS